MYTVILSGGELGGLTWTVEDLPTFGTEFTIGNQGYRVFDSVTKSVGNIIITTWYATWMGEV